MLRVLQAVALSAAVTAGGAALAQGQKASTPARPQAPPAHGPVVTPDSLQWGPAPAALPSGAQAAVLEGDPGQKAPFTLRLRLPDGYRIPPHMHPGQERVTVLSGTLQVGMGRRFDASALKDLPAGSFFSFVPGTAHFAQAKGETILQLTGVGPWDVHYLNPSDDPRQARAR